MKKAIVIPSYHAEKTLPSVLPRIHYRKLVIEKGKSSSSL